MHTDDVNKKLKSFIKQGYLVVREIARDLRVDYVLSKPGTYYDPPKFLVLVVDYLNDLMTEVEIDEKTLKQLALIRETWDEERVQSDMLYYKELERRAEEWKEMTE